MRLRKVFFLLDRWGQESRLSNYTLATHIVYTNGASSREVAEAIAIVYEGMELPEYSKIKVEQNPKRVIHKVRNENCEDMHKNDEEIE